jgi:hypothetical protein
MSPIQRVVCTYGDYKKNLDLPDLPPKEKTFNRYELSNESAEEITKHHFDTGTEIGENNRHGGHERFTVGPKGKEIGTLRFHWGFFKYTPFHSKEGG